MAGGNQTNPARVKREARQMPREPVFDEAGMEKGYAGVRVTRARLKPQPHERRRRLSGAIR